MTRTGRAVNKRIQTNTYTSGLGADGASRGFADTTGIVALDSTAQAIVLAFRGSHSVRNWLADLAAGQQPISWCAGCMVHDGFYSAYMDEAAQLRTTISALKRAHPSYRIVATGHSLGGALAQLAAADLRAHGLAVDAFTYGSPRIGNEQLSHFISTQPGGNNFRVTHADDPVPRLPLILMGYQHVSPEYHISDAAIGGSVQPSQITIYPGGINFGGNTADDGLVSLNIPAHLHYLIKSGIADCAPLEFELK